MNRSPLFMRPSFSVLGEERSMMQTALSGGDNELATGMGIVLTPFANAVSLSVSLFHSRCRAQTAAGAFRGVPSVAAT